MHYYIGTLANIPHTFPYETGYFIGLPLLYKYYWIGIVITRS